MCSSLVTLIDYVEYVTESAAVSRRRREALVRESDLFRGHCWRRILRSFFSVVEPFLFSVILLTVLHWYYTIKCYQAVEEDKKFVSIFTIGVEVG